MDSETHSSNTPASCLCFTHTHSAPLLSLCAGPTNHALPCRPRGARCRWGGTDLGMVPCPLLNLWPCYRLGRSFPHALSHTRCRAGAVCVPKCPNHSLAVLVLTSHHPPAPPHVTPLARALERAAQDRDCRCRSRHNNPARELLREPLRRRVQSNVSAPTHSSALSTRHSHQQPRALPVARVVNTRTRLFVLSALSVTTLREACRLHHHRIIVCGFVNWELRTQAYPLSRSDPPPPPPPTHTHHTHSLLSVPCV
jgi:hypothetical protein